MGLGWNDAAAGRSNTQIGNNFKSQVLGKGKKGVKFGDEEEEIKRDYEKALDEEGDCSDSAILIDGRHDSSVVN